MKKLILLITLFHCILHSSLLAQYREDPNLIIITADGLRWQEIYQGPDTSFLELWDQDCKNRFTGNRTQRRSTLMPFVWNTMVNKGRLYGNRQLGNKVETKNFHRFSYPGYNELFCGFFDPFVNSNGKNYNKNVSVLEAINHHPYYKNKVVAFTSWEIFPYILNEPRSGIMVNSGWETINQGILSEKIMKLNKGNINPPVWKGDTRYDDLTWNMSMEYMKENHPKVSFISLDDTDHFGHKGDYPAYLQAISNFDTYLKEIYDFIQGDDFYRNSTYLIITTDHGRGTGINSWSKHGIIPFTSGETWFIEYGPTISPDGELNTPALYFQQEIAYRIAEYTNVSFRSFVAKELKVEPSVIEVSLTVKP